MKQDDIKLLYSYYQSRIYRERYREDNSYGFDRVCEFYPLKDWVINALRDWFNKGMDLIDEWHEIGFENLSEEGKQRFIDGVKNDYPFFDWLRYNDGFINT